MGRKMSGGGVIKRSMVDGMEEDGAEDGMSNVAISFTPFTYEPEAVANIEEFLTMIAGGLAGASPHMISATVTAISRLVFEFKGQEFQWFHYNLVQLIILQTQSHRKCTTRFLQPFLYSFHPPIVK